MAIKPYYFPGEVHWIFECGCEYQGQRYRVKNLSICLNHKARLKYSVFECCLCGKKFKTKERRQKYCDSCREKKGTLKKIKGKKCSRPGCNNTRPEENVFLCNTCKKNQSSEVIYA